MEIPLESTRNDRLSGVADDYGTFNSSTNVDDRSTEESREDDSVHVTSGCTTSSIDVPATVNGAADPALDASFDLTVHGEVEDEVVESHHGNFSV